MFHGSSLPTILSPTTPRRPSGSGLVLTRELTARERFRISHPLSQGSVASWASPLTSRLATTTGRIEFVILRTGRSPPVALHPASRRRSYVRLQSSDRTLTGTFTPQTHSTCRRTSSAFTRNLSRTGHALGRQLGRFSLASAKTTRACCACPSCPASGSMDSPSPSVASRAEFGCSKRVSVAYDPAAGNRLASRCVAYPLKLQRRDRRCTGTGRETKQRRKSARRTDGVLSRDGTLQGDQWSIDAACYTLL